MFLDFGFYPHDWDETVGDLHFSTLPGLQEAIESVCGDEQVEKDWFYAPALQTRNFMTEEITVAPYSARVFRLPKTHRVQSAIVGDEKRLAFLAHCFGFFVGMRMSVTEAGFLDATPIRAHVLTDFITNKPDLLAALTLADGFWLTNEASPNIARSLLAAIHALFLSQQPRLLDFEEFILLYTALDACHAVRAFRNNVAPHKCPHGERIHGLCLELGIATPPWAIPKSGQVWVHRNSALHEGLFFGEPLGVQILTQLGQNDPTLQQMRKLLCRIIVGLLGIPSGYTQTRIDDRQRQKLSVTPTS